MCNYFQENIGIVCTKQVMIENFSHILVSKALTDICFTSANSKESGYNFPLYLYPD